MFFLYLILVIFIFAILIFFSKIQVNISNIRFTTYKVNNRHLQKNYQIEIKLYILKRIRILKIKVTKQKLEKLKLESKLKKVEKKILNNNIKFDLNILEILKQLDINLEKLNLNIKIGTENSALTSIIFGVISSVIPIVLKNKIKDQEKQIFNVVPVYTNENLLNIELDCIFSIKMIHIIYIIYILSKKGRDEKYVRTSNRRAYGYSYE